MKKSVEVSIMGQKLQIRSDSDEGYIEKVAQFVDGKIDDVLKRTKSVASAQVVILAAMNIADEFLKYKMNKSEREETIAKKIESMIEHIDLRL